MAVLTLGARNKRRRLNIAAMPNCEWWVDCGRTDTHTYATGVNVSQVRDLSGKGRHMTKTGAGNETVYPTYVAAEKAVYFLNSAFDQMIAGAQGDWNFLHNGNGATVLLLVKIESSYTGNGILLSTASETSGGIGLNLFYFNTNQQYNVTVRNGTSQTFYNSGATNSLAKNTSVILSYHMQNRTGAPPDLVTRYNGATDLRVSPLSSFSASNSTGTLFIGKLPDASSKARMYFKKCAIFSRRITKAEENMILEAWAREENISLTRYPQRDLIVLSGQSNATGYGQISESTFAAAPSVTNANIFNTGTMSWATLNAGTNNLGHTSSQMGIEMTLGRDFVAQTGRPVYIAKYAIENQGITNWDPGDANFDNLKLMMQRALWELEDAGYTVKTRFVWYQGESDAMDGTEAAQYQTRLQNFLTNILGGTPGYEQSPSYIVQIDQNPVYTGTNTVKTAQMAACMTVPYSAYAKLVEVADIVIHSDQNHMTAASYEAIGTRVVQRMLGG
jgi:hypothetical protein